ncbi:hypothetical protein [Amycolatopsis taiwanensis]|uniref:hypothetical protein n=1 Tax=Amycolatopsis taiwanensis TaxID=342230 RepID=UPI0012EB53BF|nr:hypothetical protein [Amycolatopsis taiwanensis]
MKRPEADAYRKVLDRIYQNATYTAQSYFEAAKGAQLLGKLIVFVPALISAIAGALVALDFPKAWGIASATAGLVSATGSFLGAERKAPSFRESARRYTQLRHTTSTVLELSKYYKDIEELASATKSIEAQYAEIISRDEPISNWYYRRASKRIKGVEV